MSRLRLGLLVVLGALIAGCSSYVTPYPMAWAALSDIARDCRGIAGTYAQRGERGPGGRPSEEHPRLTWLATGREIPGSAGGVASVSFPEADIFEIKAGDVQRWRFSEGGVSCRGNRLELRRRAWGKSWLGPTWHVETVSLSRSIDGWLVAEREEITWAWLLFVPGRERAVDWYRYPPVNAPTPNTR